MRLPQVFSVKATLYLPFMVAVPQLAYHYELVCVLALLPTLGWYARRSATAAQRSLVILTALAVTLTQFPAVTLQKLTDTVLWHFVPGFGLLLVMVCVVALRFAWGDPLDRSKNSVDAYVSPRADTGCNDGHARRCPAVSGPLEPGKELQGGKMR